MLVVMQAHATEEQVRGVCQKIEALGYRAHSIPGAERTAIGITGNKGEVEPGMLEEMSGVQEVIRVTKPYKLVSRDIKEENTVIRFAGSDATIGGPRLAIIAGPCAIESREQAFAVADRVQRAGAQFFRGGAYKPRTSPYSFQGLGEEGLQIMAEVRENFGLRTITEAIDNESLDLVEQYADIIQIGARNMQNYSLLRRAGRSKRPVMVKRGMSATLEEFLMAAEYVMSEGNYNVILCERGIRTFADHTRNTLDLSVVPAVQRLSHLPIIVDPSQGTGKRNKVTPLSRAAIAVGADGLIIEVHHQPDKALSDGMQSLYPEQFDELMAQLRQIAPVVGRTVAASLSRSNALSSVSSLSLRSDLLLRANLRKLLVIVVLLPVALAVGWLYFHERQLTDYGPAYREYAYISNGKSNTVSVIDLRTFLLAKTIKVGSEPTGVAASGTKNEIYVVNAGSNNVSVIDAERNAVVATIGVHGKPYFIDVAADGKLGYVANSDSANVSVIDLDKRVVVGNVRVGASPGLARVSPDSKTVVVSNRGDNTVSLIDPQRLVVRSTIPVCQQPEDITILPDSSKAFVACAGSGQVASIDLKNDKLLALLDVGKTPVHLALKPDGGELMVSNFDSDNISIIETTTNEVGGSYLIGTHPAQAVVTADNSRLYVSNFGSNTVAVYDIDIGKMIATLPVGSHPDGLALSQSQNYLLVLNSGSGDVTVIQKRTPKKKFEPGEYSLLTMIPVGVQPNNIVVKSFVVAKPVQ